MLGNDDDTAAIDMSIVFFSAVLMMFVFVAFNLDALPDPEEPISIGQSVPTVEVLPRSWSPINERGSYSVLTMDRLYLLDLSTIGKGVIDSSEAVSTDDAFQVYSARAESAPNAFRLLLTFNPDRFPEPWVRESSSLMKDSACIAIQRPLLTVLAMPGSSLLVSLMAYVDRCGIRLRLDFLPKTEAQEMVTASIGIGSASFRAESIFR